MLIPIDKILKIAEIKTQLLPHQSRVVDRMKNQSGLVVAHGVGSGKSVTSLAVSDALNMPANVVTPAALKANFKKEYDKHTFNSPSISQEGLENISRKGQFVNPTSKNNKMLIIDEAHRLRTPGSKALSTLKNLNKDMDKTLLLTGTPMYNSPENIAPLVNLAAKENLLPENRQEFENKYLYNKEIKPSFLNKLKGIEPGTVQVINKHEKENLRAILNKWVDYHPSSQEGFPTVERQDIEVPMSDNQLAIYNSTLGKAPPWVEAKIRANMPTSKRESKDLSAYLTSPRQALNSTAPFVTDPKKIESPKIQKAFEEFKRILGNKGKGIVYSNFIGAGIDPYKQLLEQDGTIPFGEYSGRVDQATRDQLINDYNNDKVRALLLGPSANEGLDLQKTKLVQLLESNWNESKGNQAEARAIRYGSHAGLDPEKQKVLVQRFLSTYPTTLSDRVGLTKTPTSVDQYLRDLSKRKTDLSSQFEALMKEEPELRNEKIAKISDDVETFLNSKNYKFLLKKLPSKGFQSSLLAKIEDPSLKNFVSNNGKHFIALKKRRGEIHSVESSSQPAKSYDVIKHKDNSWTCSCNSYLYNKSPKNEDCKHIDKLKSGIKVASAYVTHFDQQSQTTCSSACAKMVLDYYGIYKTEEECSKLIGVHSKGAENNQISEMLTKLGLKCINKELTPEEVKQFLDMNCPIIIDGKSFRYPDKFHYTVLSDLDLEKDVAVIFDPNYDKKIRTLTLKELDEIWHSKQMYKPHKPLVRQGIVVIGHEKTAYTTENKFIKNYGEDKLKELSGNIVTWLNYNNKTKAQTAVKNLAKNKEVLKDVMNFKIEEPIYRGLTLDSSHSLTQVSLGAEIIHKAKGIESWSTNPEMALSFANSKEWHKNKLKSHAVVLEAKDPTVDVILAPHNKTAPWFEKLVLKNLDKKIQKDRKIEDEYLVNSSEVKAKLHIIEKLSA